jgi:hypothetical protein
MGVFKEHANAFEMIAQKQTQIYSDACDYGYPYDSKFPSNEIKALIHYVNDLKGTELMVKRETWGQDKTHGVRVVIQIGWEIDEGMECGTQYDISFNKMGKNPMEYDSFISVDIENYRKPA